MEPNFFADGNRQDVIVRLRQQVAAGSYEPPVDELVNRLVDVVLARRTTSGKKTRGRAGSRHVYWLMAVCGSVVAPPRPHGCG